MTTTHQITTQPDRNGNIRIPNIIDSKHVTQVQINDYSLRGKEIEELYIPQNVESLYFPYNVSTVVVSENNQKFTTDGYGVYSKDKKIFYRLYNHCPQLKHYLSKAALQIIQEWSDKMPTLKFICFLKLWIVVVQ